MFSRIDALGSIDSGAGASDRLKTKKLNQRNAHFVSPRGGLLQSASLPSSGPSGNCPDECQSNPSRGQFFVPPQRPPESHSLRSFLQPRLRPIGSGVRTDTTAASRRPVRSESFLNRRPVPRVVPHGLAEHWGVCQRYLCSRRASPR